MSTLNVCLPLLEYVLCLYVMHQVVYGCARLVSSAVLARTCTYQYVTYCALLQHELERLGDHMTPDADTQARIEQEAARQLNERQLQLEQLRLDGIARRKERQEAALRLEQEFTRLQQQQQAARQERQSDTLAGHVVESREESLVDAQQRGWGKTSQTPQQGQGQNS